MRRLPLAVVVALLAATLPADAAPAATTKIKVKCHWVKATKKRKRHKACVKVKAKKTTGTTPAASPKPLPSASTSTPTPVAPSPVPGTTTPAASPAPNSTPDPSPVAPAAARLQATTREWSITLSRPSVPAGALILQLVNRGEDAHDLHLRPSNGGSDLLSIASTESGDVADVSGTLTAGTYTLYCALPGHEAAGMKASLIVQ